MSNTKSQQFDEALARYAKVQARVWSDNQFKADLLDDPKGTLAQYGVGNNPDVALHIVLNDSDNIHLIIPERPAFLTNDQVEVLAAAGTFGTGGSIGTAGTSCGCVGTFGSAFCFGCASL